MGQINDTTGIPKTESIVRIQKNVEAISFPTIKRGVDDILEGALLVRGAGNVASRPEALNADSTTTRTAGAGGGDVTETEVLISWIHPNHTSGLRQLNVGVVGGFDPSINLNDALLAAIEGDGLVIGLPLTARFFNDSDIATLRTADKAVLVLKGQSAGAPERVGETVIGIPAGGATAPAVKERKIGTKAYVDGDILYFSFKSSLEFFL